MPAAEREPRRVVVTGLGAVTSIGTGREPFWRALLAGTSGVSKVQGFDVSQLDVDIAAQIHDFDAAAYMSSERAASCGRASRLGIAAARLALEDAGLTPSKLGAASPAVLIGTTMGESDVQEKLTETMARQGFESAERSDVLRLADSLIALNIAAELELDADCGVFATACAAGNYAIGDGFDRIRAGLNDLVLAGGSDAFSRVSYAGFARMNALAPGRCQPFDKHRQGIVIGEGAGVVVLEALEHARARGARIDAEVLGYGLSCDAHHMTIPHAGGIRRVMQDALEQAGLGPGAVSAISAHGTGTPMNDKTECEAIHAVFGDRSRTIPVNSIKSMLGHTMGAASALEAIACILSLAEGLLPPTINYETPDEECPIDCVPNRMRAFQPEVVLNNSFAFGANNACTVLGRYRPEPRPAA